MSSYWKAHRPIGVVAIGALLLLWLFTGLIALQRGPKGSSDFDTFYEAGKAVLHHTGTVYYEGEYYQQQKGVGPFLYPPIAACFLAAFAFLPMPLAAFAWNTALLVLFLGALFFTFKFLDLSREELPRVWNSVSLADRLLFAAVILIMLVDNLVMAQVGILIFLLCAACLVLWKEGKNFRAGLILSTAVLLKLTPVFFCFYFLYKRAWKLTAGVVAGALMLTLVVPTLIFGWEGNRIYHRQWFGRMIKPMLMDVLQRDKTSEGHPLNKSYEEMQNIRQTQLLVDTNQSLPAALTRLFLKDRHLYQVTYRYERLPVIGGGFSRGTMATMILSAEVILLLVLVFLFRASKGEMKVKIPLEVSLVFLSTVLLSPIARSHSFIVWVFVFAALFFVHAQAKSKQAVFIRFARGACVLYLLLALPYGEAVGMGAWANLALWVGCAHSLAGRNLR
ncbi:MAG: DUF2029 domain-containing protein [Candidatus Omnitrophica bacterium]|nr:DUF2029 domain-containing protein [Candidatus Omnitrophota bacterium]